MRDLTSSEYKSGVEKNKNVKLLILTIFIAKRRHNLLQGFVSVNFRKEPTSLADGLEAHVSITKLINRFLNYGNITTLSQLNGN